MLAQHKQKQYFDDNKQIRVEENKNIADLSPHDKYEQISRSEEHTSELQSRETISYAVFCLKKKKKTNTKIKSKITTIQKYTN